MDARQARSVWTVCVFSTALGRQGLLRNDVNAAADFRLQSYAATGRRGKVASTQGKQEVAGTWLANDDRERYSAAMTTIVDAIYEHGKLVLSRPLSLPEKS